MGTTTEVTIQIMWAQAANADAAQKPALTSTRSRYVLRDHNVARFCRLRITNNM